MSLRAHVVVSLGDLDLDVEIAAEPGEVVAVLGPNGAGKTTLLRALEGLVPLDAGRVEVDGTVLDDPSAGVLVPPDQRAMGVVFQDYLLFGNLTALENVAFGLRARGMRRATAREAARRWLARVDLEAQADMKPRALSGGQAQRVALARALALEPRILLLDEPLAALDAGTRADVRRDLRRHLDGFAGVVVLVTHDPIDAHALADRVVVIEGGRVVQQGGLGEVTAHPRSRYVADLVGTNLVHGELDGHVLTTAAGGAVVVGAEADDGVVGEQYHGPAFAAIRPQAVAVHRRPPEGSPRNAWACTITGIDRHGDRVRLALDGAVPLVAEITAPALVALGLQVGDSVWAAVKAAEVVAYPE